MITMNRTVPALAALAVLIAGGTTACGGKPSSSAATATSGSPSDTGAPSGSASASPVFGATVTTAEFQRRTALAQRAGHTLTLTSVKQQGAKRSTSRTVVDYRTTPPSIRLDGTTTGPSPSTTHMIVLSDGVYIADKASTPSHPRWGLVASTSKGPGKTLYDTLIGQVAQFYQSVDTSASPAVEAVPGTPPYRAIKVEPHGEHTWTTYQVSLDAQQLIAGLPATLRGNPTLVHEMQGMTTVDVQVLDELGRCVSSRKTTRKADGSVASDAQTRCEHWGDPVRITAPPAAQVTRA